MAITKTVIRDYMFSRSKVKVGSSFNRIALAISTFCDHFGATSVTAPRASHMPTKDLNVQMPTDAIKKIKKITTAEINKAQIKASKPAELKHLQKLFGKQTISAVLTVFILSLVIFLVSITGCRPNEACYIVLNKSV